MVYKQPKRKDRPGVDRMGRTPLHYAAGDSDLEQCRRLVGDGLDPAQVDDNGWGPLHFAVQANASELVEYLLSLGVPVDPRDIHGNTPLFKAVFSSRGDGRIIRALREAGADPKAENLHGNSPVVVARRIGNYDVAQFFSDLA